MAKADLLWKGSDRSTHITSKGLELQILASRDEKVKKSTSGYLFIRHPSVLAHSETILFFPLAEEP